MSFFAASPNMITSALAWDLKVTSMGCRPCLTGPDGVDAGRVAPVACSPSAAEQEAVGNVEPVKSARMPGLRLCARAV